MENLLSYHTVKARKQEKTEGLEPTLRRKKIMKLCKHWEKKHCKIIERSTKSPWNAIFIYDSSFRSFEAGSWWAYMHHLRETPECRKEIEISLEEVEGYIGYMNEELEKLGKA